MSSYLSPLFKYMIFDLFTRYVTTDTNCSVFHIQLTSACVHVKRDSHFRNYTSLTCLTTLRDWLKKFTPLSRPVRSKAQTNRDSLAHIRNMYLLRVLIGSVDYLCPLLYQCPCDSQKVFHKHTTAPFSLHSPRMINWRYLLKLQKIAV